jgi:PAS domain S-box-containing protein
MHSNSPPSPWRTYGTALLLTAVGAVIQHGLEPVLDGPREAYPVFLLAVLLSAWLGGFGPGLLATVVGGTVANYLFVPPKGTFATDLPGAAVSLLIFLVIGVSISAICESLRAARGRAETQAKKLEDRECELRRRIDEKEAAERARAVSEADLTAMFHLAGAGLCLTDAVTGRFLRVNDQMCQITGYPRDELLQLSNLDITHPEDLGAARSTVENLRDGEIPFARIEKRYVRKDGSVVWIEGLGTLVRTADGRPKNFVGVVLDITERNRMETELRDSETRLRLALDGAELGLWTWDLKTDRVTRSPRCFAILGLPEDSTDDSSEILRGLVSPEDLQRLRQTANDAIAQHMAYDAEFRFRRPDGMICWAADYGCAEYDADGNAVRMVGIMQDISARKQAAEALHESELRLQLALDSANIGIHEWCPPTGQLYWDDRLREHWGIAPGTPVTYDTFRAGIVTEDWPAVEAEVNRAIDPNGNGRYQAEFRVFRTRDQSTRWIYATGRVFFAGGEAIRLVGTATDVTARKNSEALLRDADRRKDEFLAMLAHELRNPLGALNHALSAWEGDGSADTLDWAQKVIRRQASQLNRLVDDLLDVSRISQGKVRLQMDHLDLREVIDHAVESVRPMITERQHEFHFTRDPEPIPVKGDAARLQQVIVNLLGNAAKYTEPRGRMDLAVTTGADFVRIEVLDNGQGIPPEQIPLMFELFAQGDRGLARSEGGLGLGLTIVRKLVQMHGGDVSAQSKGIGQGSRFTVQLPRSKEFPIQFVNNTTEAAPFSGRVLVVDDNRDSAEGMEKLLRRRGFTVATAFEGRSAITTANEFIPDAVLLDIGLPGLNGYEVARELRRQRPSDGLLLVAVSGYGQEHDRAQSRDAGFDHHLTKPVDLPHLLELLEAKRTAGSPSAATLPS